MGEIIIPNAVVRKPGFLYYIDGEGNICEAQMAHHGRPKKEVIIYDEATSMPSKWQMKKMQELHNE